MSDTVSIFGIPVAKVTEAEAVEWIVNRASCLVPRASCLVPRASCFVPRASCLVPRESCGADADNEARGTNDEARGTNDEARSTKHEARKTAFIATLNVDFVSNAVSGWPFGGNDELWGYLKNADFVTADGMPIVLLSRLLGNPIPERVTGADMVPAICKRFAEEGMSIYILGQTGGMRSENLSGVKVAGFDESFVKLDEDQPEIIERINAAKPDLLFVALGNPKQELWMGRNAAKLHVPAMIGVGGTFNFIAGHVKRAPRWMQKCGLEWIYRVSQEPGRLWRRYAYGLVKFSWLSLRAVMGGYR